MLAVQVNISLASTVLQNLNKISSVNNDNINCNVSRRLDVTVLVVTDTTTQRWQYLWDWVGVSVLREISTFLLYCPFKCIKRCLPMTVNYGCTDLLTDI